jgi:hypothetical protein
MRAPWLLVLVLPGLTASVAAACGSSPPPPPPPPPSPSQQIFIDLPAQTRGYLNCVQLMRAYVAYSYQGSQWNAGGAVPTPAGAPSASVGTANSSGTQGGGTPPSDVVLLAIEETCRELAGLPARTPPSTSGDAAPPLPQPVVSTPPTQNPPPPTPSDPCLGAMRDCGGFHACERTTGSNESACNGMKNFSQMHGCWRDSHQGC